MSNSAIRIHMLCGLPLVVSCGIPGCDPPDTFPVTEIQITSVEPPCGVEGDKIDVEISEDRGAGGEVVLIDGFMILPDSVSGSPARYTCTVPPPRTSGSEDTVPVSFLENGPTGTRYTPAGKTGEFTYMGEPPQLDRLEPKTGAQVGGELITVYGAYF